MWHGATDHETNITFRTQLIEMDVRKEMYQLPDDRTKIYTVVFSEFEAPRFLILTRLSHNLTA